jgi:cyanophycinase-like exopeptidase
MNQHKPVYLLSGGRGADTKSTISNFRAVFEETAKEAPEIAYVGVASDDNWAFFQFTSSIIKQAGKCQVKRVVINSKKADLNKAKDLMQKADAIFMSGGDVERGIEVLEEKSLMEFLRGLFQEGKLFFGASAGSIMMAREWVRWRDPNDDSTAELFPCLGFTPVICDTHAEADNWEELQAALKVKGASSEGYGIPTGSCLKVYPDDKLEALSGPVCHYVNRDGKVERLKDLMPVE